MDFREIEPACGWAAYRKRRNIIAKIKAFAALGLLIALCIITA